jgi:hypothetical protein
LNFIFILVLFLLVLYKKVSRQYESKDRGKGIP